MHEFRCEFGGNMDDSKFNEPMPWIGIYIVVASVAISIAMAADAFLGFQYRKFWFPCKFFGFNATSLTLIAVVVKLSVDLNTAMPQRQDQLAKLSSAVLICTVMGNSMPSIGVMENKEIMMNIVALGILVITLVVNICIQLVTGAIYIYWKEHIFIMFLMLVLLMILVFSALTVPTTKSYFELKYCKKYELALKEGLDDAGKPSFVRLRNDLMKYWIMAHTCCPQFVIGRSATCTASGAFCVLAALTLAQAMARSYLMPWTFSFCIGDSDYKWSTTLILITQTVAVGVGTIAPASRWFTAISFRCPKVAKKKTWKDEFRVEGYWVHLLVELRECPLMIRIHGRHLRKLAHDLKWKLLNACIGVQYGIVVVSKFICLLSVFFVCRLLACIHCCAGMWRKLKSNSISSEESQQGPPIKDLSRFVLRLEGEEELVDLMMKDDCNTVDCYIRMGRKSKPKNLIRLLEKSTHGFNGVKGFDSKEVHSLTSELEEEPPNCWALPIVTLTSIAISLPNIDKNLVKWLTHSVHEGLSYVRLIETYLEGKQDLTNVKKAAAVVWIGVDLYHKWLDIDLRKLSNQPNTPMEILEELSNTAKKLFIDLKAKHVNGCQIRDSSSYWPVKVLAANSMYRLSQTIQLNHRNRNNQTSEGLFESISFMISDIFAASFTNLPRVIAIKCYRSTNESREEGVRQAIILLGKIQKILKIIDGKMVPMSGSDQLTSIREWCLPSKLSKTNKEPISSSELCIIVD